MVIFCLQVWKGAEVKKTRKLTHDEIKKQLIESVVVNEMVESDELNKQTVEVQDPKKQKRQFKNTKT